MKLKRVKMNYYINYFIELVNSGSFYWFCALAGSGMFFIQFLLNIFGMSDQDGLDVDGAHANVNHDVGDVRKFKWLSMQALTGFLMMFGWTAVTCQYEFGFTSIATIAISLITGFVAAWIIRSIFRFAKKFHSSGSVYKIEEALGNEAYVYHSIPKGGLGKISISLQNITHEIHAVSKYPETLPSFMRVKIIEIKDDTTVVVIPL